MKKALFLLFFTGISYAAPGCMDNSYHLTKPCDPKTYHLVINNDGNESYPCTCPCKHISLSRGTCLECGHFRYLKPGILIEKEEQGIKRAFGVTGKQRMVSPFMQHATLKERALMRTLHERLNKN